MVIIIVVVVGLVALTVGWAIGQGLCRRSVRKDLWLLFYELDTEPPTAKAKYDVLELIRKLELN